MMVLRRKLLQGVRCHTRAYTSIPFKKNKVTPVADAASQRYELPRLSLGNFNAREENIMDIVVSEMRRRRINDRMESWIHEYDDQLQTVHFERILLDLRDAPDLAEKFFVCGKSKSSPRACCILVHILASWKKADRALRILRNLYHDFYSDKPGALTEELILTYSVCQAKPLSMNLLIKLFIELGLAHEGVGVFTRGLDYGIKVSLINCNHLLDYLFNSGKHEEGQKVYKLMLRNLILPNAYTYGLITRGLCKSGHIHEAKEFLFETQNSFLEPLNAVCYSNLISGICRKGMLSDAFDVFKLMKEKNVWPNAFTYSSLISALCKSKKNVQAEVLFCEMTVKCGIEADVVAYSSLIDVFCKARRLTRAIELVQEMKSKGIRPDKVAHNSLLDGLCKAGMIEKAQELFENMRSGIEPDNNVYSALIDVDCRKGDMQKAFEVHNEMVEKKIAPNVVTYTILISGLCKQGDVEIANKHLQDMVSIGLVPNIWIHNCMIKGLCVVGKMDQAVQMLDDLHAAKLLPNLITYNTIIDGFCSVCDMASAMEYLSRMIQAGIEPDLVTHNTLLGGLCRLDKLEEAYLLLGSMAERGISPNAISFNTILRLLDRLGKKEEMDMLSIRMEEQGMVPYHKSTKWSILHHEMASYELEVFTDTNTPPFQDDPANVTVPFRNDTEKGVLLAEKAQ